MQAGGVFVCECGVRLRIAVEGRESNLVPCPNAACRFPHVVSGRIVDVLVEQDGQWVAYDWKASEPRSTSSYLKRTLLSSFG